MSIPEFFVFFYMFSANEEVKGAGIVGAFVESIVACVCGWFVVVLWFVVLAVAKAGLAAGSLVECSNSFIGEHLVQEWASFSYAYSFLLVMDDVVVYFLAFCEF